MTKESTELSRLFNVINANIKSPSNIKIPVENMHFIVNGLFQCIVKSGFTFSDQLPAIEMNEWSFITQCSDDVKMLCLHL